jgi:septum formation protein
MKITKQFLVSLIREALNEAEFTSKGHWGKQGSGLILTTGERMLLLLRSRHVTEPGTWGIPGGAVEDGEDPFDSALRETEEEMRLSIDSYELLGQTVFQDDEDGFKYTTYILKVPEELTQTAIILDWENDDYDWIDQDWLEDNADKLHSGVMYTLEQKWSTIFDSDYL